MDELLQLLPGWATDHRIFGPLENHLKEHPKTIIGFSLGGLMAVKMAKAFPEKVSQVILISIRPQYPHEQIKWMQSRLQEDKHRCLSEFYQQCFENEEDHQHFKKTLMSDYLDQFGTNELSDGLAQLGKESLSPETLSTLPNLVICHGTRDKIAPFSEAKQLAASVPSAQWVTLKGAGHVPFFHKPHVDQILSSCNV